MLSPWLEKTGGSDVDNIELEARWGDCEWRLYGQKWFCLCADGDVAILLAKPEGDAAATSGLDIFAAPRHREDGALTAPVLSASNRRWAANLWLQARSSFKERQRTRWLKSD